MITVWRRSASFRSTSSSTSSSSSSSFASSPLCSSLSPSTSSSPLRYPFYKKNFECYETSSKLRTNFVRCETLITNLSPTTNGSPWQPVSSCRPSCSSNSSYRPSCPSSGQQLVLQCRKRLSCPSSPLQSHLTNNIKSKLRNNIKIWVFTYFFKAAPTQFKVGTFPGPAPPLKDRDYRLQSKVFYDRSHLLGYQALKQQRQRQRSHHLRCKALKPHRQRQRSHLLGRQPLKPWISRSDCEELGQERVDCYRWNKTFCADLKDKKR